MLCGKIEDSFSTVFRQVVLTRFELSLHRARREEGELAPARLSVRHTHWSGEGLGFRANWQIIPNFDHAAKLLEVLAGGRPLNSKKVLD